MNINEVEKLTGISKQNIRFYESKGLLKPSRNKINSYREYSEEDIKVLNIIKLFRLLDFSIEQIELMQKTGEICNVEEHINLLKEQIKNYEGSISICEKLKTESNLQNLNPKIYLDLVDNKKREGYHFNSFIEDYKFYLKRKYIKEFSFIPDNMCMTKEEFTEALLAYANEKKKDITIIKESMYPEFVLDGYMYEADRVVGRYGAVVRCKLKNNGDLPEFVVNKKRKIQVLLIYYLPLFVILALFSWMVFARDGAWWLKLILGLGEVSLVLAYGIYWKNVDN